MFNGKYEIYQSEKDEKWYWRLRAANNEILCHSQGYASKQSAERGVAAVRRHALFARTLYV